MTYQQIKEQDQHYILHTYGRVDTALVKGKNARAWDADRKEFIDFTSGIGVNALGYSDPQWVAAVTGQAGEIQHMSNYYYSSQNIALAEALCQASGMAQAFFCNSGAEANECAFKIARKYGEKHGASTILTLTDSFHGRTLATLAATGQEAFHQDFQPLNPGFLHAPGNDLDAIADRLDGSVCAVLVESIQGEGGVVPMDGDYLKSLQALCQEKDVLFMLDEVQTGIGRTGYFYSCQQWGITPDVITTAKGLGGGLPIGACLVAEPLRDILKPGQQGSTFGGNPVVCAGARVVVERVNQPEFLEDVRKKGQYFTEKLCALPQVEAVRGRGLMLGIRLNKDCINGTALDTAHDVLVKCAERGLLVLTAKDLIRFLPPLTIPYEDIDAGLDIFAGVLAEL